MAQSERKSPKQLVSQKIAGINIQIEYGQPSVKDREIFGSLVPYDKVWRTGANEATTISFDRSVKINGKPLAAGKYSFFLIPRKQEQWTLIFNNIPEQWGAFKYDESEDALRLNVSPIENDMNEKLKYSISEDGWVTMAWDTTRIEFKVEP